MKTTLGTLSMARRTSEEANIPSFKKLKNKKKGIEKKKKPEITSEIQ
jgi:hypothetical protein